MRKQDLYIFIEEKLNDKNMELSKKRESLDETVRKSLAQEVKGLDAIGKSFARLTEVMEKAKEEHKDAFKDWALQNRIRDAHGLIRFKQELVNIIFNQIVRKYLKEGRDHELKILESQYPESLKIIAVSKENYDSIRESRSNVRKLGSELEAVIKSSRSAKEAYKSLVALGVDMKGFEESSANLPAVQKLSVDVCFINGNC